MYSFNPTPHLLIRYKVSLSPVSPVRNFAVKPTSTMLSIVRRPASSNQSKQWIRSQRDTCCNASSLMKFPRCIESTVYINREWSDQTAVRSVNWTSVMNTYLTPDRISYKWLERGLRMRLLSLKLIPIAAGMSAQNSENMIFCAMLYLAFRRGSIQDPFGRSIWWILCSTL